MTIPAKSLTDITNQALHVLTREIGSADTMRFIGQFSTGTGNYTEERAALFDLRGGSASKFFLHMR